MNEFEEEGYVARAEAANTVRRSYIAMSPVVKAGSQRLQDDLDWFENEFAAMFPAADETAHLNARYWYLMALQRVSDYENDLLAQINLNIQESMDALRKLHGEMS